MARATFQARHFVRLRRPVIVEPRSDGLWVVQTQGTQRHDSTHQRKLDAVARGRQMAQFKRTELLIKTAEGSIEKIDSQENCSG